MKTVASRKDDFLLQAYDLSMSHCVPMSLTAVVKLKVIDILAEKRGRYLSAAQIAAEFKAHSVAAKAPLHKVASTLDRMLRLLASHGLLSCSPLYTSSCRHSRSTPTYALNSASTHLTTQQHMPSSVVSIPPDTPTDSVPADSPRRSGRGDKMIRDRLTSFAPFFLLMECPILQQTLYRLGDAILNDVVPFTESHGMPLFTYTQHDPEFHDLFNLGMASHSKLFMTSLLSCYGGFESLSSLVDVGGGTGACLSMITARYPHITGTNFDLPHVVATAPEYPGVEHVGGDMFEAIPKSEALFMKWLLHCWSDSDCLKILDRCYEALSTTGKVIVVDILLPDEVECNLQARTSYKVDCYMLAMYEGAKERTRRDLEDLAKSAGFKSLNVVGNVQGISVVEMYKI